MKKILFTLLICLCLLPGVKAETVFNLTIGDDPAQYPYFKDSSTIWTHFKVYISGRIVETISCDSLSNCYSLSMDYFNSSGYTYYSVSTANSPSVNSNSLELRLFNKPSNITLEISNTWGWRYVNENGNYLAVLHSTFAGNNYYGLYDTNYDFKNTTSTDFAFSNFYVSSDDPSTYLRIPSRTSVLKLKDLLEYSSWQEYESSFNYTTVNLNDYEYVILKLKDYSKKSSFETNLKVKGMVGITPVYEFGTVEKDSVTDRCNVSYSDFTDYRFFITKNDLINNAVYYVKACEESSAFKFDSTVFDVTYITADTVDDTVITVGGNTYQVIPFNKLSTTANSNEENNFIPGQTGNSFTDIIDNALDFTTGIWDSVTSFMTLVTKFFNTLPQEIRAIIILGFTTLTTIAIIKFLK